jgi:N4-gp56 family major capsid protein
MPDTTFSRSTYSGYASNNNANLIEQKWAKKAFKHGLAQNPLKNFIGTGADSIIQVDKNFIKGKGDKITFHMRALLSGDGQGDDGTLEGNEEANSYYDEDVVVHERAHATRVAGVMTEQRTTIPLRSHARDSLGEWIGRINAADIISALSGVNNTKSFAGQMTGAQATDTDSNGIDTVNAASFYGRGSAPTMGGRIFYGGQTTAGALSTVAGDANLNSADQYKFGTRVINYVKRMAETHIQNDGTIVNPIRPVTVNGKPHYVMFISPAQAADLKKETAWLTAQRNANVRGMDNPIFSGALGMWDNVIIHVLPLIHRRYGELGISASEFFYSSDDVVASGYYVDRALFCGAQAGLIAYGMMPTWKEKKFDYGRKYGISTTTIYGTKKPQYNSRDFGVIAVDTNVDPNSA